MDPHSKNLISNPETNPDDAQLISHQHRGVCPLACPSRRTFSQWGRGGMSHVECPKQICVQNVPCVSYEIGGQDVV